MSDLESWGYAIILIIGLAATFGTLFRKDDTEEDDVGLYDGSSDELLKAKLTCLMMAQSNTDTHRAADDIVKDAQKFWDFLVADDDEAE